MKKFFDEKSDKWILYFKYISITIFFLCVIYGGLAITSKLLHIDGIEGIILYGFLILIIGFINLVVSMLFIQLLNNVQIIRKSLESKEIKEETKEE